MSDMLGLVPLIFVGIDWGSVSHRIVVVDAAEKQVADWTVAHQGDALIGLVGKLVALAGGVASRCFVAIEVTSGPVVEALLDHGLTVFAVNPKQTDRFRDRFMPSGAKDDRRDALVLATAVRKDREHLARLSPTDRRTIELRGMLRLRQELVDERSRLVVRLREQLWQYYAQMVEIADGDFGAHWLWRLLERAPMPQQGMLLSKPVVKRILDEHHVRKLDASQVLAILRKQSLIVAEGAEIAGSKHVLSIIERLRLVTTQIGGVEREMKQQLDMWSRLSEGEVKTAAAASEGDETKPSDEPTRCEQRDEVILRSLPGVGTITLATLLAEVREPLSRRDYNALRAMFGVAPVTRQSGKMRVVAMRRACSEMLRNAAFNWARAAVKNDERCRARRDALVQRGKTRAHAYRAVIDHLLRIACAMLRAGTVYDASHAALAA